MSTVLSIAHQIVTSQGFILVFKFIYYTSPAWITIILALVGWNVWLTYVRAEFIAKQKYVLLEIRLPRDVFKNPSAMEFLFNSLYQPFGEDKLIFRWRPFTLKSPFYWEGSVRSWFSLELCAIDGKVRFFIWGRAGSRNTIEAQPYSQYPGVEIFDV